MRKTLPFAMPLFRSILFIALGLLFIAITDQTLEQASRWWSVLCSAGNIITILVLIGVCKYEGTTYRTLINFQRGQLGLKVTLQIVVLMLFIGVGGLYAFGFLIYGYVPTILIQPIPIWVAIINTIVLPLTIVFAEMPLYFGYSLNRMAESTGSKLLSIGYPMFFYALMHSFIPLLFDWKYMLFRFLSFLPLMMVLGVIYYKKRNLAPLMIGHGVLDTAAGLQILVSSISPAIFEMMQQSIR